MLGCRWCLPMQNMQLLRSVSETDMGSLCGVGVEGEEDVG